MAISLRRRTHLRMFDVEVTKRIYVDYLGCTVDWAAGAGAGDRPGNGA